MITASKKLKRRNLLEYLCNFLLPYDVMQQYVELLVSFCYGVHTLLRELSQSVCDNNVVVCREKLFIDLYTSRLRNIICPPIIIIVPWKSTCASNGPLVDTAPCTKCAYLTRIQAARDPPYDPPNTIHFVSFENLYPVLTLWMKYATSANASSELKSTRFFTLRSLWVCEMRNAHFNVSILLNI